MLIAVCREVIVAWCLVFDHVFLLVIAVCCLMCAVC